MDKLPWINILSTFIQRKKPPKYWKIYAVNKIFMRPTVALVATNIMLIWSDKDGKSENMIPSFCPLTTSNQKLSKHDARCFLSRFMSHRPPFLFLSSSHIGFIPSWNILVWLSGKYLVDFNSKLMFSKINFCSLK